MSATVTDNPMSTTLHRAAQSDHLQDYEVRLTTDDATTPAPPNTENHASPSSATANPPVWDEEHRGVPPYRPINQNLDFEQRPWAGNPVGAAFVFTMFTGVSTLSTLNSVWRSTGGKINDRIFRYPVGGEI